MLIWFWIMDNAHKYMTNNKLRINMSKSVHMHFKPSLSISDRLTCARVRAYGSEHMIKIGDQKLKKVDRVKFLGVVIDEDLKWEPHVQHLTQKLKTALIMIKRIIKFIPKSEYMKIYDVFFKSHLSYCISSWGAIFSAKLQGIFLYRKGVSGYFLGLNTPTATLGTMKPVLEPEHLKNFCLEHTKP